MECDMTKNKIHGRIKEKMGTGIDLSRSTNRKEYFEQLNKTIMSMQCAYKVNKDKDICQTHDQINSSFSMKTWVEGR